jgi:hypothetical protein
MCRCEPPRKRASVASKDRHTLKACAGLSKKQTEDARIFALETLMLDPRLCAGWVAASHELARSFYLGSRPYFRVTI